MVAHAHANEELIETVAWVQIRTGAAGGCAWPGFVGVIEVDSADGLTAKGTLTKLQNASKCKSIPEELLAEGTVICSCTWEGGEVDLRSTNKIMFEPLQDRCATPNDRFVLFAFLLFWRVYPVLKCCIFAVLLLNLIFQQFRLARREGQAQVGYGEMVVAYSGLILLCSCAFRLDAARNNIIQDITLLNSRGQFVSAFHVQVKRICAVESFYCHLIILTENGGPRRR